MIWQIADLQWNKHAIESERSISNDLNCYFLRFEFSNCWEWPYYEIGHNPTAQLVAMNVAQIRIDMISLLAPTN